MVEQPHFDDERTLLTARPVVPLEAIEAKVKHRRRWFLGGAFAIAMFLGAASALVSAYLKLRHQPEAEIQSLSVVSVPEEETPPAPTPEVTAAAPEVTPEAPEVTAEAPKPRPRNTDHRDRPAAQPRITVEPRVSDNEALRQVRDSVLLDQWEERRARRVERRERRRAQHNDRDLSN